MVEEKFDEIIIEGRGSISREDLLKYIGSNFERLSLRNIESLQEILSMQNFTKLCDVGFVS